MGGEGSGRKGGGANKRSRTESLSHAEHTDGSSQSSKPNAEDIRNALQQHNFFVDNRSARKDYPKVIKDAEKIIGSKRGSAMGDDEQEKNVRTIEDNELVNEDTFIDILWGKMFKETRMVRNEQVDFEDDSWMSRAWELDFLHHLKNRPFRPGCLPVLRTDKAVEKQLIESLPKLSLPQPDLAYGILASAFTNEEHQINLTYPNFTDIAQSRYHAFFIVEFKSHNGSLPEATNQACRTASALVHGLRGLDAKTPSGSIKKGVDSRTWCFSLALNTSVARLFVNWAFVEDNGTVIYHMHKIATYTLDDGVDLAEMKKNIGNIMDWGVGERLERIKKMLGDIYEHVEKKQATDEAPASSA